MVKTGTARVQDHFTELTDPRTKEPTYPLINIVVIAMCAVISGSDDFVAIAEYGRRKKEWLGLFLDLSAGIPSHDRFNAIFRFLKPGEFEKCLLSWITDLYEITGGQIVPIDGKTLRGSYDRKDSKAAIHMVSAWASANHISLGQVVVDEKSNEITAIPKLLELLEIAGCLVTIDAMGCQTEIAEKVVGQQADYLLAVKGNQPTLLEGIEEKFDEHIAKDSSLRGKHYHQTHERTYDGEVIREYFVIKAPDDLPDRSRWPKLKAIGMALTHKIKEGEASMECRYYITSRLMPAKDFGEGVRTHWSIENRLHWQLDVSFSEDRCRVRKDHADANLSIVRRAALSLLKNETTAKVGVKNKRLIAALDETYLQKVLFG